MPAIEKVQATQTPDGAHVEVLGVLGERHITRRDDLRGIWQVDGGGMYPTRQEAVDAAVKAILADIAAADDTEPVKG